MRGLISCNQYADQLYGPEQGECTPSSDEDIGRSLTLEIDMLRGSEQKPRRFQAVDTGTKHLIFIKCHPSVDPVSLVHHMLSSVMEAKENKARYNPFKVKLVLILIAGFANDLSLCLQYVMLLQEIFRNAYLMFLHNIFIKRGQH